jgi:hypothetical protein
VAKYSASDGSHVWSRRFGGTSSDEGLGVAVDSGGNVVVTGTFRGTVDFGGGPLTGAGFSDIFVAKYSASDGSHIWSRRSGGPASDLSRGVALDSGGNVVVTGGFRGTVDFGGGSFASAGKDDIFVATYSASDGSHVWSRRFGGTSFDEGLGVAVDSGGRVVVTGNFSETVDFGGVPLTSAGLGDVFLLRLRP